MRKFIIDSFIYDLEQEFAFIKNKFHEKLKGELAIESDETSDVSSQMSDEELINKILNAPDTKHEKHFISRFFKIPYQLLPKNYQLSVYNKNNAIKKVLTTIQMCDFDKKEHLNYLNALLPLPKLLDNWMTLNNLAYRRKLAEDIYKRFNNGLDVDIPNFKSKLNRELMLEHCLLKEVDRNSLFNNIFISNSNLLINLSTMSSMESFDTSYDLFLLLMMEDSLNVISTTSIMSKETLLQLKRNHYYGEPRKIPLSSNWERIKYKNPDVFLKWQKSFNEQDIEFFFNELNQIHPERKKFWLEYKNSADYIYIVIDQITKNKLQIKYANSPDRLEVVNQSLCFNSQSKSEQFLLVMIFNNHVIVEGSNTGFGCQFFLREIFQHRFGSFLKNENNILTEKSYSVFRGIDSKRIQSLSHINGWQKEFRDELKRIKIYPK